MGLAITQAISLTGLLQWGIRQMAELENQMTSVERILEYTAVQSEPPLESLPGKCHKFCVISIMKNRTFMFFLVCICISVHKPKVQSLVPPVSQHIHSNSLCIHLCLCFALRIP